MKQLERIFITCYSKYFAKQVEFYANQLNLECNHLSWDAHMLFDETVFRTIDHAEVTNDYFMMCNANNFSDEQAEMLFVFNYYPFYLIQYEPDWYEQFSICLNEIYLE